jgi:HEAT repeat protein
MRFPTKKPNIEKMKSKKDVARLIEALGHEDAGVRGAVARALGEMKDTKAVEPLIQALKDEDRHVKGEAALALGKLGDEKAVEPLIIAWGDTVAKHDPFAGIFVLGKALGKLGDKRVVEPLIKSLNKEWYVREAAAAALGELGGERAVESLIQASNDEVGGVREVAKEALDRMKKVNPIGIRKSTNTINEVAEYAGY